MNNFVIIGDRWTDGQTPDRHNMPTVMDVATGIPGRPLKPLKVVRGSSGSRWLEWTAAVDRPEDWPVVGFVVEAMAAGGEWTEVGRVGRDLMSDGPTTFRLDDQLLNDDDAGQYAFRVFADNRAALSEPLQSNWITATDFIGDILTLS